MTRPVVLLIGDPGGIAGRAALALAKDGKNVAICHQSAHGAALRIARQAADMGVNALPLERRLNGSEAAGDLAGAVLDHWGRIDAAIYFEAGDFDQDAAGETPPSWLAKAINTLKAWRPGGRLIIAADLGTVSEAMDAKEAAARAGEWLETAREASRHIGRRGARAAVIAPFENDGMEEDVLTFRALNEDQVIERILDATRELTAAD